MDATMAPSPSNSAASPSQRLPKLELLDPSKPHVFLRPAKRIIEGHDVARFLSSKAYRDMGVFLMQLNRAMCPRKVAPASAAAAGAPTSTQLGPVRTFPLSAPRQDPESVRKLRRLLQTANGIVAEAPPDPGPRRFGNVSFRKWHQILEDRAAGLLREYLPTEVLEFGGGRRAQDREGSGGAAAQEDETIEVEAEAGPLDELKAYFLGAFGSPQRLDYGTGHELSFMAFLGCLWKLGAFKDGGTSDDDAARSIVLGVFEPYFEVIRHVILEYTLEPAGSHGVWGLDDHFFIPYIFGSAQLTRPISNDADIAVDNKNNSSNSNERASVLEPMPLEGSLPDAPSPASITKPDLVKELRKSNMYFSAVGFINDVKTGPFWEHSPMLFDISGIRDGWGKINKGMVKMFNAEVLSKFPVVQHFPFGSLLSWDPDPDAALPAIMTAHMASQPGGGWAPSSAGTLSSSATSPSSGTGGPTPSTTAAGAGLTAPSVQQTRHMGRSRIFGATGGIPYTGPHRADPREPAAVTGIVSSRSNKPPVPLGGIPDTGPPPPSSFPKGEPGTASNQFSVTRAPWAK